MGLSRHRPAPAESAVQLFADGSGRTVQSTGGGLVGLAGNRLCALFCQHDCLFHRGGGVSQTPAGMAGGQVQQNPDHQAGLMDQPADRVIDGGTVRRGVFQPLGGWRADDAQQCDRRRS
ncbi:hypothetical protein D3C84_785860 [compost metagenome]